MIASQDDLVIIKCKLVGGINNIKQVPYVLSYTILSEAKDVLIFIRYWFVYLCYAWMIQFKAKNSMIRTNKVSGFFFNLGKIHNFRQFFVEILIKMYYFAYKFFSRNFFFQVFLTKCLHFKLVYEMNLAISTII